MKLRYRITKYNPRYRDKNGAYLKDEWTSASDIGKIYEEKVLSPDEYLRVEDLYIYSVMLVLAEKGVDSLKVTLLEKPEKSDLDAHEVALRQLGLVLDAEQRKLRDLVQNGDLLRDNQLKIWIQLVLREILWSDLESLDKSVLVEFGYDYYMYIVSEPINYKTLKRIEQIGLYIEISKYTQLFSER